MINPGDGGLRCIPHYMVPDLEKLGWRVVMNPKRKWYPEFDRTAPSYKEQEVINIDEDSDTLEVEKL